MKVIRSSNQAPALCWISSVEFTVVKPYLYRHVLFKAAMLDVVLFVTKLLVLSNIFFYRHNW